MDYNAQVLYNMVMHECISTLLHVYSPDRGMLINQLVCIPKAYNIMCMYCLVLEQPAVVTTGQYCLNCWVSTAYIALPVPLKYIIGVIQCGSYTLFVNVLFIKLMSSLLIHLLLSLQV